MGVENLRLSEDELRVLGGRIKAARKNAHYTQNAVSDLIECSIGHLSAIENGKTMPGGDELVCFCRLYKRDMVYFFNELLDFENQEKKVSGFDFSGKYGYMSDETLKWFIRAMQDAMRALKEEETRRANDGK